MQLTSLYRYVDLLLLTKIPEFSCLELPANPGALVQIFTQYAVIIFTNSLLDVSPTRVYSRHVNRTSLGEAAVWYTGHCPETSRDAKG